MTEFKFPEFILDIEEKVKTESTYSKDKSDEHGEVFTPFELINEMLDQVSPETWSDSTKTVFDPCAGTIWPNREWGANKLASTTSHERCCCST